MFPLGSVPAKGHQGSHQQGIHQKRQSGRRYTRQSIKPGQTVRSIHPTIDSGAILKSKRVAASSVKTQEASKSHLKAAAPEKVKFEKEVTILKKKSARPIEEDEHLKIIEHVVENLGHFLTNKSGEVLDAESLQQLINASPLYQHVIIENHGYIGDDFVVNYIDFLGKPQILRIENVVDKESELPIQEATLMILQKTMEQIHEVIVSDDRSYKEKAQHLGGQITEMFLRKLEPVVTSSGAFSPIPSALSSTPLASIGAMAPMVVDFTGSLQMITGTLDVIRAYKTYKHAKVFEQKALETTNVREKEEYIKRYQHEITQSILQFGTGLMGVGSGGSLVTSGTLTALEYASIASGFAIGAAGAGIVTGLITGAISVHGLYKHGSSKHQLKELKKSADQYFNTESIDYDKELHELVKNFIAKQNRLCNSQLTSNSLALGSSVGAIAGSSLGIAFVCAGPTAGLSIPIAIGVVAGVTVCIIGSKIIYDKIDRYQEGKEEKKNTKLNPLKTTDGILMELAYRLSRDMRDGNEKESFIGNQLIADYLHLEPKQFITLMNIQFRELKQTNEVLYYRIVNALDKKFGSKYEDLNIESAAPAQENFDIGDEIVPEKLGGKKKTKRELKDKGKI